MASLLGGIVTLPQSGSLILIKPGTAVQVPNGSVENDARAGHAGDIRGLQLALAMYVVVLAAKLGAYYVTGVIALFAEALHTLSDIFISGFLLVATLYSRRAADERHMFGYGRAQNIASLVAATLFISFTSFELYREALPRLLTPEPANYENLPIALSVILGSMVLAAVPLWTLLRQRVRGAAAKAQLIELVNDQLGLLAALAALAGIAAGFPLADPIAALVVATIIAVNAVGMFLENARFLLGRAPDAHFMAALRQAALSVPGVTGIVDVRAEFVGPQAVHAGVRLAVRPELTVAQAAGIAREVERRVHAAPHVGYCFVQMDPAEVSADEPRREQDFLIGIK
jgi:cation diffusion facilitator family transporter